MLRVLILFLALPCLCVGTWAQTQPQHQKAQSTSPSSTVLMPKVTFSGQLLSGNTLLRACAGGVDDHAATDPNPNTHNDFQYRAHTRQVDLTLTLSGKPVPDTTVTLKFDGNKGHDYGDGRDKKTARLHKVDEPFDADHPWKETLEVKTDVDGKASVWVLSSDVLCQPKLQAMRGPLKLGQLGCDFAESITFRHFYNPFDPDEAEDDGWLFDFPNLVDPTNP